MLGISGTQQLPRKVQHVQRPRNGVIRGLPSDMFLERNLGHSKWVGPDLALKRTRNCRRLWAGMRSECSFKEVPFAAVLRRDGVFSREGEPAWKCMWVLEL
jgi:hypothetical protein